MFSKAWEWQILSVSSRAWFGVGFGWALKAVKKRVAGF